MTGKSPAFQFYYKEWITGTIHMTRIERDIYLTLLIYQYDLDGLPNDMKQIERYANIKTRSEREAISNVMTKFRLSDDGKFRNTTMEKVRTAQKEYKAAQSENGKKGAENRWKKNGDAIVSPLAKNSSASTTASTTDINTLKGASHFSHIQKFFSEDYEKQQPGFKESYTKQEYESFKRFLTAIIREFNSAPEYELQRKFDKCISIGDWKKYLNASPFMVVKPFIIKALGAPDGDRNNMAARIATYSNGAFDEKVLVR